MGVYWFRQDAEADEDNAKGDQRNWRKTRNAAANDAVFSEEWLLAA